MRRKFAVGLYDAHYFQVQLFLVFTHIWVHCYLRQGGYVFVVVCLPVCLFACLLITLCKNFRTDLHEIFTKGWQWASEQTIKCWWRSGSGIRITDPAHGSRTLVRRTLVEVCNAPVLLAIPLFMPICYRCCVNSHITESFFTDKTIEMRKSGVTYCAKFGNRLSSSSPALLLRC